MDGHPPHHLSTSSQGAGAAPLRPSLSEGGSGLVQPATSSRPGSTSISAPAGSSQGPNAKVPIPRQRAAVGPRHSRRVAKACESCRQRKTKCSGDTPVCRQCRELRVPCQYPAGMRERTRRRLEELSSKAQDFENLLRELGNVVDSRTKERIRNTLEKHGSGGEQQPAEAGSRTPEDEGGIPEFSSPSSIGSLEAIDRVEEDLNRGAESRATGYIGKNSEISWMQRLQREAEQRSQKQPGTYEGEPSGNQGKDFSIASMSYHLDDLDISVAGPVNLYWMPPRQLADQLFEDYLTTVHPFFPIINRPLFVTQYRTFFDNAARPGDRWLAILNMIFAISAKHAHLIRVSREGEEQDHLTYFTRARILSMNGDVLFSHPDLQQVQVEGLISFYLLASDQINRAWRISALAVRSAIALGINMKSVSETTHNTSKEMRYRVWWCLYAFEHMLGIMTGRATCSLDGICTSPLPIPFEEDKFQDPVAAQFLNNPQLREERIQGFAATAGGRSTPSNASGDKTAEQTGKQGDAGWLQGVLPNRGLFFLCYIDLSVITQEIVNKVYNPDAVRVPWSYIEKRIGDSKSRIDLWFSQLPEAFDFTRMRSDSSELLRLKLGLAFHYYSAQITLGRPCLCRRDARSTNKQIDDSFSHGMAIIALEAAARMLDLIPDQPNAIQLYQICPWWCILHYLMQATTVLLLELSFGNVHTPDEELNTLNTAKKAVRWLHAMSEGSIASRRAWRLCDSCLRRIAIGMDYDLSDMPSSSPDEPQPQRQQQPQQQQQLQTENTNHPADMVPGPILPATYADWSTSMNTTTSISQPQPQQQQPQQQNQFDRQPVDYTAWPVPFPLTTIPGSNPSTMADIHFPYDPITGEFIRSFFPDLEEHHEKYDWDQGWGGVN